jgi:hypothetical protein
VQLHLSSCSSVFPFDYPYLRFSLTFLRFFTFIYPRLLSLCHIFFSLFFLLVFRSSSILSQSTFTGDVEVAFFLRGAHGVSGLWLSPPAITQPHHVTSVDRCSCCRQTNHHSTFGLASLCCPSLRLALDLS